MKIKKDKKNLDKKYLRRDKLNTKVKEFLKKLRKEYRKENIKVFGLIAINHNGEIRGFSNSYKFKKKERY
jgi:hypothetical protein